MNTKLTRKKQLVFCPKWCDSHQRWIEESLHSCIESLESPVLKHFREVLLFSFKLFDFVQKKALFQHADLEAKLNTIGCFCSYDSIWKALPALRTSRKSLLTYFPSQAPPLRFHFRRLCSPTTCPTFSLQSRTSAFQFCHFIKSQPFDEVSWFFNVLRLVPQSPI